MDSERVSPPTRAAKFQLGYLFGGFMRSPKLKSAWLVTWQGTNPPENSVVAILDYRKSARTVQEMVEMLYAVSAYSQEEKLWHAKSPKSSAWRAKTTAFERIECGHNPSLYARRVTSLSIKDGQLVFSEPPPESEIRQKLKDAGILR
jgi:hypothetical protein